MKINAFIKLNRELLSQPEVDDLLAEEGAAGLGIYVAVNLYLAHCEGGCGVYSSRQLSSLAVQLKKHRSDVDRIHESMDAATLLQRCCKVAPLPRIPINARGRYRYRYRKRKKEKVRVFG